ncbi:unnamed protein product [Eruca vesicaria subsp. sativa]|uniref:F-box domain-containing protein n=1 Tax=Eruca vesicaria subsp. sativa TaxID=29727 RepID=A0ABC8LVN2_ERUVS|nr:unnamed protein product [Eruca vesicaria subsp. sativa]
MEDSQPSPSRLDLDHTGNCTTTTTIPFDLIIEILSRLPAKSLLRFQSVSKLCLSTIRSKFFVDLFLTRSKTRPRLLFTFYLQNSWDKFLFSAPEYDNNEDDKSSSVLARYDMMTISELDVICGSVNGFICCKSVVSSTKLNKITVYNPTTRQIIKLPDVTSDTGYVDALFGYDPVEDQYKVLCVNRKPQQQEFLVCTLISSQKQEWRKMENTIGDNSQCLYLGQVCIDGAVYYSVGESMIVRFDVRSEKIEFIKTPKKSAAFKTALVNYNGKFGRLECSHKKKMVTLWVLEDVEKQEWSSMTYAFPYQRWEISHGVSVVPQDGIRWAFTRKSRLPFRVCYYDFNKKNVREVEIRGMEDGDLRPIDGFGVVDANAGHIENIRFL